MESYFSKHQAIIRSLTKDRNYMYKKQFILSLFAVLAFTVICIAQHENSAVKAVSTKFETFYNHSQYDSIFLLFAANMQQALPLNATNVFLLGLKKDAGNISIDDQSKINGFEVTFFKEDRTSTLKRNITTLSFPANDNWTITWGGDTKELNYHVESKAQKNAFDILIKDAKNKSYQTNGKTNEDYYAFGKELFAPCDAEVVSVVDGISDNIPGQMNPIYVPGNTVVLKTSNQEYLFFCHFKQHSIQVKQDQKIKKGQLLGLCGNSGNSSEPHIHFHLQDTDNMLTGIGIKCYFEKIMVNGQLKTDYSPIQKEIISQ